MTKYIVVFITASSEKIAKKIADGLIGSKLAACVNILPKIDSIFIWKGKKETAKELLLIVKTREALFPKIKKVVKRLHTYQTPEIIAIPIIAGDADYLRWIKEVLR